MNSQSFPTNPFELFNAIKPAEWATNATSYARTMINEWEKQAERWTEYGVSQTTEATRLLRTLQTQAFDVSKSIVETAEKAFHKTAV